MAKGSQIQSIENLFKIGYSTTSVEECIKNADKEPTYLMAPIRIVTTFLCYNMNPNKLEGILHKFFGSSSPTLSSSRFMMTIKEEQLQRKYL